MMSNITHDITHLDREFGGCSISPADFQFWQWLDNLKLSYQSGQIDHVLPGWIEAPFGSFSLRELDDLDEPDTLYLEVAFILPDDVYVEIEHSTYGQLQGFRIYKESE